MAVGFGYIRDDKPTQIDWGQITKDATEALKGIEKDRQGRRDKIAEDQKEFTKMLMERPMGGDTRYQKFMGEYTTLISKAMLDKMNQLKRGDITEQEFTTFRGTVTSGATGMMAGAKAYVEGYDTMAELAAGDGAALTNWQNEKNQRLFNLEGISSMIDPVSGETTFFVLNEDGEKEVVDMSQFLRRSVNQQTAFDTEGEINSILETPAVEFEDQFGGKQKGQFLKQVTNEETGEVTIEFDESIIRQRAKSAVQQNTHVFDILMRDKTGYRIQALPTDYYELETKEERDAYISKLQEDTSVLYVDNNDTPLVSDAQRQEAENYIVEQVRGRATKSVSAAKYLTKEVTDTKLEELKQSIEKSKADQKYIEARTESEEVTTSEDFKKKLPKIQEYLTNQLAAPIEAAVFVGEMFSFTDKDNQVAKTLNNLLSSMGISADSAKFLKQSVKIKVPKEDGGTRTVTIDLAGKSGMGIFDEILKQLMILPEETLDKLYTRVIDVNQDGSIDVVGSGELD
tara:strand:- start:6223 stop:7761 length:1539 start_codon:yes stop_codon:yes gene_type:complete